MNVCMYVYVCLRAFVPACVHACVCVCVYSAYAACVLRYVFQINAMIYKIQEYEHKT